MDECHPRCHFTLRPTHHWAQDFPLTADPGLGFSFSLMDKAGAEYQDIVAIVAKALDPDAEVAVGEWVEGPDGRREIDVKVRGTVDGASTFILIECKDWKEPIGISAIDALESKSRDLGADCTIIYSNSGFTEPALRKAKRVGIQTASALRAGDARIHIGIFCEFAVKRLSVDTYSLVLFPSPQSESRVPPDFDPKDLTYEGRPVINWVSTVSRILLVENEGPSRIHATYAFREEKEFYLGGTPPLVLRGLRIVLFCSRTWVSQIVQVDATLGLYDHLRRHVRIPNYASYKLGPFDNARWQKTAWTPENRDLEPGTFEIGITLLNPVPPVGGAEMPSIDELTREKEVETF